MNRLAVIFSLMGLLCCASVLESQAPNDQDTEAAERQPRVFALLIDWTGGFIGRGSKPQRIKEKAYEHASELLLPRDGESPLGFNPARDRLFVAYFGLITDRPRAEIQPLEDFFQIHLNVDQTGVTRRDLKNAIYRRTTLRTSSDQSGAQFGYPSIAWTLATHRINLEARAIGLKFESITMLSLTDGRVNTSRGSVQGEKGGCVDLLRSFPTDDAYIFEEFFRVYGNNLEVVERDLGIRPISGIGEDGKGYLNGFYIHPQPAGINLAEKLKIEAPSKGFQVRHDGSYEGEVILEPLLRDLAPAQAQGLTVELLDGERRVHGPAGIDLDAGRQVVWNALPGHLGSGGPEDLQYSIRAAVTIDYPESNDGRFLSQFVSPLTYQTPVPVVRMAGWLFDARDELITPQRMKADESPEEARQRINASIGGNKIRFWATLAAIAALVIFGILYVIFYYAPPRLELLAEDPRSVEIDLRNPLTDKTVTRLGTVRILNRHQKRGRFWKWSGSVKIDEISARPGLLFADGVRIGEVVTLDKGGAPRDRSPKVEEKEFKVLELYLRPDLIIDLEAPGLPDSQGRFEVELEVALSLETRAKTLTTRCRLKIPLWVLAPPVRWKAEWVDGDEEPRIFYTDLVHDRQEVKQVRLYHEEKLQALWPQRVRLVVAGPKEAVNPDVRFGDCPEAGGEAEAKLGPFGAEVLIPRFGPQRELIFPVYHGASLLEEPTLRDHEMPLQLYRVEADFLRSLNGISRFWVGLKEHPPFPLVELSAWDDERPVLVEYPQRNDTSPTYRLNPRRPKAGGRKSKDPWEPLALFSLGNRAEKPQPARRRGDDDEILTGEVAFWLKKIEFSASLPDLDLDAEAWEKRLRLVRLEERKDPEVVDYLKFDGPFAQQEPSRQGPQKYRLELNQFDFDKLRTEYSELEFTLTLETFLDSDRVGEVKQEFVLPLIADYGSSWFLMDIGTSAIAAMVADEKHGSRRRLELQVRKEEQMSVLAALEKKDPIEKDLRLLPTHLFIERREEAADGSEEDQFVLDFNTEASVTVESTHQLPPFKLLVGSRKLQLEPAVLARLGLEEPPEVDDVLRQTMEILLERYIKPALGKDEELPNQCVLSVPNTFTPAHCTLLKSMFRENFGVDRVIFLSESDAVCWHYVSLFEAQPELRVATDGGLEYALIVDVGAGTTDLTYVALQHQEENGKLKHATIIHRDGFKVAGNNVDTCLSRVLHHKLDALCGLEGSHLQYDAQARLFAGRGEESESEFLNLRDRNKIAQEIGRLKRNISPDTLHAAQVLKVPSTSMFNKLKEREGPVVDLIKGAIQLGVDQDTNDEFTLQNEEFLHAPAYRRLVMEEMTAGLVRFFFTGCPETWRDAPTEWKSSTEHFPIHTLIVTGRGSLTPGFRTGLIRSVNALRPADSPELSLPDFSADGKKPEELKFAVLDGACSYLEMYGSGAAHDEQAQLRESGLYEDYYLYTGRGSSFSERFPLLTREQHGVRGEKLSTSPGNPLVRRFRVENLQVPFRDADGKVVILATTSNPPPEHPFETGSHARPVCHFTQGGVNRMVEIDFSVDTDRNIDLSIDQVSYEDRMLRYDNELLEMDSKARENLWPGRPAEPGDPAEHYSLYLPRRHDPNRGPTVSEAEEGAWSEEPLPEDFTSSDPDRDLPQEDSLTDGEIPYPHQVLDPDGISPLGLEDPVEVSSKYPMDDGVEPQVGHGEPVFSDEDGDLDDDE